MFPGSGIVRLGKEIPLYLFYPPLRNFVCLRYMSDAKHRLVWKNSRRFRGVDVSNSRERDCDGKRWTRQGGAGGEDNVLCQNCLSGENCRVAEPAIELHANFS